MVLMYLKIRCLDFFKPTVYTNASTIKRGYRIKIFNEKFCQLENETRWLNKFYNKKINF